MSTDDSLPYPQNPVTYPILKQVNQDQLVEQNFGKKLAAYDPEIPTNWQKLITPRRNPASLQIAHWFAAYSQLSLSSPVFTVCTAQWSL